MESLDNLLPPQNDDGAWGTMHNPMGVGVDKPKFLSVHSMKER